ncbi:hypothetical protein BGW39_000665, partial [Mortierella sp. 14UC]
MEQYVAGLEQTLQQVLFSNNSEQIKEATKALSTQFFADANCVPALVHIIQNSPQKEIRQLAAVELRKQISNWWDKLDIEVRTATKANLLQIILKEQEPLPRHSTARVIATVGRMEIPANTWNELLTFLFQCSNSATAGHREVGVYVIYAIFEVTDAFSDNLRQLLELFSRTIVDADSHVVRITTVQALGKMADFIEEDQKEEIAIFAELVPQMVNVLQHCLNESDEESAAKCFDVFDTLLLLEIPILSKHIQNLIQFFLTIGGNKTFEPVMRVQALSFIMWAIVYKKTKIQRLKLVSPMIQALMPIAAEEEPEDSDEDSPARLAFKVINTLATNLPPQQVFPVAMEGILAYMANADPLYRKAAMVTLAVLVEGSVDFIRPKFNDLLLIVCAGLQDPEANVRRAACMALSSLAEEFDEVAENHATLLPLVFNLMNEPTPEITKQACNALDAILEGLGENILQYLTELMQKLLIMLDNAQGETRAIVVAAIGSAAHASGTEFTPYFPEVIKRLQHLMTLHSNEDELMLRAVSTDALGAIAAAVGKDAFRPYLNDLMNLAMQGLLLDNTRLRECGYYFFAGIAQVFEDEFSPYLAGIVPQLIASCQLDENTTRFDNETGDQDDVDGEDTAEDLNYVFRSAIADEKEVAADTIGEFFQHTRTAFLPYVESSVKELVNLTTHMSDGVRKASCGALFNFLRTFYKISNPVEWKAGLPVAVPLHDNVTQLNTLVMPSILSIWEDEDDKMVVVQLCQEMVETLKLCGPGIVAEHVNTIAEHLNLIFEKKAFCQQELADDEGLLDEDEQAEFDALLISSASDLVGALAAVLGESFVEYAKIFVPHIAKYYKKSKPTSERSMAIGCLGEIAA